MKRLKGYSEWINLAPKNPTQTLYSRFLRAPWGEMKTAFTESRAEWDKVGTDAMKTAYDDIWRGDER